MQSYCLSEFITHDVNIVLFTIKSSQYYALRLSLQNNIILKKKQPSNV